MGMLGAITRKQNEITKYIDDGDTSIDKLKKYKQNLESKIKSFEDACQHQLSKKISDDVLKQLKNIVKNIRKNILFI